MDIKFEYIGTDDNFPGSKIYNVKAITVTTTRNDRKYKENELQVAGRSLSFRPLNRNHDPGTELKWPANQTLVMDYNQEQMAVTGKMRISDPQIIELIDTGKINKLSIEQIPYKGEDCSIETRVCEQNGIIFTGMALLDWNVTPGDQNTEIRAEKAHEVPISEMIEPEKCEFGCPVSEVSELAKSKISDKDFAYVGKDGTRKLPIHDKPHVRNALARFNQTDLPASAKAGVLSKIKKRAKSMGIQVSEDDSGFGDYDDMDSCVQDNSDREDPYGYCTRLQQGTETYKTAEWPKIEAKKDAKLSMDDIKNTFNSMNDSQISHIVDPNDRYKNTKKFASKKWDDLNDKQQKAMIMTYGFRHSYNDVKHLLGDNEEPPQDSIFNDDLLGQGKDEKQLIDAAKKLAQAGIKEPIAQSMAVQNPNNKTETEKTSLISETVEDTQMTGSTNQDIKAKIWSKEKIDALKNLMLASNWSTEKINKFVEVMNKGTRKTEVNSTVSAFVGMQNNKAPLSDALANVLYDASDDELDQYARVTMDQNPSVIPDGGLADYKAFTQENARMMNDAMKEFWKSAAETFQSSNQKMIAELGEKLITIMQTKNEAMGTPSSVVDDSQKVRAEAAKKMYEFYDVRGHPDFAVGVPFKYVLDKNEFMTKFGAYQASGSMDLGTQLFTRNTKGEAVTVTAGDMGQTFAKQVMLLPGGRMRVPVRQYCNFTEIPNGADRANWYTIGAFDFAAVTEGTEPTNVSQTVTKVQALPSLQGAVQRIGYSQIENAPFGLVDAINNAMVLAGLADEANSLLSATGAYWTTPSNVTNWVNGNSGANITSQNDDIASMTLTRSGLIAAKRLIAAGGYDTSPGNLVLFCSPKAYQDLMLDTNLNTYYQYARPDITATYVLEQLYGIDIVPTTAVAKAANTTNATFRNVLAVKGWALGIAAAREITIEVQRRNEVQQLIVSGMHRVKAAVIDYAASCGISSAQ